MSCFHQAEKICHLGFALAGISPRSCKFHMSIPQPLVLHFSSFLQRNRLFLTLSFAEVPVKALMMFCNFVDSSHAPAFEGFFCRTVYCRCLWRRRRILRGITRWRQRHVAMPPQGYSQKEVFVFHRQMGSCFLSRFSSIRASPANHLELIYSSLHHICKISAGSEIITFQKLQELFQLR